MIITKIKELEKAKAQVISLQESIATQMTSELSELPAKYGFENIKAFIKAVKAATSGPKKHGNKVAKKPNTAGKRKRAKITDETRAELKALVEAGKSGSEIATALGISLPSVHNIKKALGLIKANG